MFGETNTPDEVEANRERLVEAQKQTLDLLRETGHGRDDAHPLAAAYDAIETAANADHRNTQREYVNIAVNELNTFASQTGSYTQISEIVEELKRV